MYIEFMEELLRYTMKENCTDLHLCVGAKPLIRKNAKLIPVPGKDVLTMDFMKNLVINNITAEQFEKLNKKQVLDFSYSKSNLGRFRCNIYIQRGTYAIAIRALPLTIPSFEQLGLPEIINQITDKSSGLILISGATGSGKSTTLASIIDKINKTKNYHILTIEEPVEYLHRHNQCMVTQREIGTDAPTFSDAIKSSLREDPDVIMVGEMRDLDTISIALSAAETGHLVLSTLHTNGAVKSIDRIIDSFDNSLQNQVRNQLSTVLQCVISQHLIPKKDESGLVLATEIMIVNPAIRNLIREGKHFQINSLIQTGTDEGMISLERNLARLYKGGVIAREYAESKANDKRLLNDYLSSDF